MGVQAAGRWLRAGTAAAAGRLVCSGRAEAARAGRAHARAAQIARHWLALTLARRAARLQALRAGPLCAAGDRPDPPGLPRAYAEACAPRAGAERSPLPLPRAGAGAGAGAGAMRPPRALGAPGAFDQFGAGPELPWGGALAAVGPAELYVARGAGAGAGAGAGGRRTPPRRPAWLDDGAPALPPAAAAAAAAAQRAAEAGAEGAAAAAAMALIPAATGHGAAAGWGGNGSNSFSAGLSGPEELAAIEVQPPPPSLLLPLPVSLLYTHSLATVAPTRVPTVHSLPRYCCPYPCPYCTLTPSLPSRSC
jgi:hypothetical protein